MTGGDFTQEAYEALRSAYAGELTGQDEQEIQGVQVMGQRMTMETLPVDSPWRGKIESWEYPTGKSAYSDGPQKSPQEVLELMREAAAERDLAQASEEDEELDVEGMSDEELDALLDEVLNDDEELDALLDEVLNDDEEGDNAVEATDEEEEDEDEDEEMTDEELDDFVDKLLADEEEESVEEADEEVTEEAEEPAEELDESPDPEEIASEIAALREQIEGLKFLPE
jgi:hypothetical protein